MKNKLNRNRFGIDKICVALNPFYLRNDIPFNKKRMYSLDPAHYVNLIKKGNLYIELQINQEALEPFLDHQFQVINYLRLILKKGLFIFEYSKINEMLLVINYEYFIMGLTRLEIYIDTAEGDIQIENEATFSSIKEARQEEGLFCYENSLDGSKTFYSNDYVKENKKKNINGVDSSICLYNKRIKDIAENHLNKVSIYKHKTPYRCEFRLDITNTAWLNMSNIKDSARQIFNRYSEYLAVKYNDFLRDNVMMDVKNNPELAKIIKLADDRITKDKRRFRSKKLKTREGEQLTNMKKVPVETILQSFSLGKRQEKQQKKINENWLKITYLQILMDSKK